jgi:hypothetical protein
VAPSSDVISACRPIDVVATITSVEGAAGSRIATVLLRNTSGSTCTMDKVAQAQLVDAAGTVLLEGEPPTVRSVPIKVGPSDVLQTQVRTSNYCGAAPPERPLGIDIVEPGQGAFATEAAASSDLDILPPCNGASQPGSIEMQPWAHEGSQ